MPEAAIAELAAAGLDGIEVDHMDHDAADPGPAARARRPSWGCWPPAPATTTAAARPCVLGEYTTDPEVYGEITRRATGAFPVPGAGGAAAARRAPRTACTVPLPSRRTSSLPRAPTCPTGPRAPPVPPAHLSQGLTVFDVAVFGSLFLTLFVIMDPPGITPIFLALTAGRPAKVQRGWRSRPSAWPSA